MRVFYILNAVTVQNTRRTTGNPEHSWKSKSVVHGIKAADFDCQLTAVLPAFSKWRTHCTTNKY